MKRSAKIIKQMPVGVFHSWKIALYIDGSYIVEYRRNSREAARKLAKSFIETGLCPRD